MFFINIQIQLFEVNVYYNGEFIKVFDVSLKGQWFVLIFMLVVFIFNCLIEIEDVVDYYVEFKKVGVEVYIVIIDIYFLYKVWYEILLVVGKVQFLLVGDLIYQLINVFGVYILEEGLVLCGIFIINLEGVIKILEIYFNEIVCDVFEILCKFKVVQFIVVNLNQVCLVKWKEGEKILILLLDLVGKI